MTQQDPGPLAAGAGPPGLPSAGPLPASLDPALAQALVDVLPAPFIFLDGEDRCRLVNRAFERLLGCGREHIVGCTLEQFCAPGQPAFLRREVHAGPWQEEVQLQGSRGVTDVLFCLAPLVDEAGQVRGHVGIVVDLTAQRQVEQRLVEAARAAEDASRAKSRFLSSMSHEIRTPLTSIIGLSGLLLETTLTSEQREYANTVLASGNLLLGVITDILDLSKIEAGSLQLEEIEIDLCEVLGEVADLESRRAQQKGLELAVFIHPEVPACVSGDPIRVRQVLLNFLGNAVKFTENGEVMLEVRVQDEAPDQVVLRFAVHDTGIGVGSGAPAPPVPGLSPGGRLHCPQVRRERVGPRHCPAPGRDDGRKRGNRQRGGKRIDVLGRDPVPMRHGRGAGHRRVAFGSVGASPSPGADASGHASGAGELPGVVAVSLGERAAVRRGGRQRGRALELCPRRPQ